MILLGVTCCYDLSESLHTNSDITASPFTIQASYDVVMIIAINSSKVKPDFISIGVST